MREARATGFRCKEITLTGQEKEALLVHLTQDLAQIILEVGGKSMWLRPRDVFLYFHHPWELYQLSVNSSFLSRTSDVIINLGLGPLPSYHDAPRS